MFKEVVGYENLYLVDKKGNIIGVNRGKKLKPVIKDRRKSYKLCKEGKVRQFLASVIVAEAFIRRREENEEVHHIDLNSENDSLENLQIISREEHTKIHARIRSSDGKLVAERGNENKASKYLGVTWNKNHGVWQSICRENKKSKYIGNYKTEEEAVEAFREKVKDMPNYKYRKNLLKK